MRTTLSAMVLVFGLFSTSAVLAENVRPKPRPEKHNVSAASAHCPRSQHSNDVDAGAGLYPCFNRAFYGWSTNSSIFATVAKIQQFTVGLSLPREQC